MKDLADYKILIVDDVKIMRKTLRAILTDRCGAAPGNIIEACDGQDAVFMYEQTRPDVVFLDIAMPDMDGREVIEKLKRVDPEPVIIMCSGSGDKMSVIECIRAGAKDYVRKPVNWERVMDALVKIAGDVLVKDEAKSARPKSCGRAEGGAG